MAAPVPLYARPESSEDSTLHQSGLELREVLLYLMRLGRFSAARVDRILAAPFIPNVVSKRRIRLAGPGRQTYDSLLAVQVCVLGALCSLPIQVEKNRIWGTTLVTAIDKDGLVTASQIASQQGMCSLDGRCFIERHDDQRFRWSEPLWSPRRNRTGDPILTIRMVPSYKEASAGQHDPSDRE
jgi:hypothetical protein